MKISDCMLYVRRMLSAGDIDSFAIDADLLICKVLDFDSRSALYVRDQEKISSANQAEIMSLAERRLNGEPMAYILGYKDFWHYRFCVTPDVLLPRPETETIIESLLSLFPDKKKRLVFADFGVGSGCIAITILREYPNSRVFGIDLSVGALHVARRNAEEHGVSSRLYLSKQSWSKQLHSGERLHGIVSNPPYINSRDLYDLAVRKHEPILALGAGMSGLDKFYEILGVARRVLRRDGILFFELGIFQSALLDEIKYGFRRLAEKPDLAGITRVLALSFKA